MIVLAVQIRLFILCILSGWMYGMLYSFLQLLFKQDKVSVYRIIVEVVFQCVFHGFVLSLLVLVNNGSIRGYYVIVFIIGMVMFYIGYYPIIVPIYIKVVEYLRKYLKRISFVFSKFISIIRMLFKKVKRRVWFHNDTSNKKKSG